MGPNLPCLCTTRNPLPHFDDRSVAACGFHYQPIHQAAGSGQAQPQSAAGGVSVFHCALDVGDAGTIILGAYHQGLAAFTVLHSYPDGAAPCGARQLIGDVWEWTASDFLPYPGFEAWPYREYSDVFFGPEYKVLRGGAFSADPVVCRATFRNWDYPVRRQIFAGFRTARDADIA